MHCGGCQLAAPVCVPDPPHCPLESLAHPAVFIRRRSVRHRERNLQEPQKQAQLCSVMHQVVQYLPAEHHVLLLLHNDVLPTLHGPVTVEVLVAGRFEVTAAGLRGRCQFGKDLFLRLHLARGPGLYLR